MDNTGFTDSRSAKVIIYILSTALKMSSTATAIDLTSTGKRARTDSAGAADGTVQLTHMRPRLQPSRLSILTAEGLQKAGLLAPNNEPDLHGVRHSGHRYSILARYVKEVIERSPLGLVAGKKLTYHEMPTLISMHPKWSSTQGIRSPGINLMRYVDCTTTAPPGQRIETTTKLHTVMSYEWIDPDTISWTRPKQFILFIVDPVPYEHAIMHMLHRLQPKQLRLIAKAGALAIENLFDLPKPQADYM